jgi:hypothetical protein
VGLDGIELGGFDEGTDDRPAAGAAVTAGEQVVLAAEGNRAVILPMSGKMSKFVTAGTRSMGGVFAATIRSGALAARSFTSKRRLAWSSSWRHGCSIQPPAPE